MTNISYIQCDGCNANSKNVGSHNWERVNPARGRDLCPKCLKEYKRFLKQIEQLWKEFDKRFWKDV